ncbi:sulfotransferase family protein [Mycobacterium sp. Marseille-P9652]|uniref:sulfotransferase family protein n=1 Tax=Mycobacterium sp. Marseille-P9652 TaxID=2654950 RepID=UPI0012E9436A|nr:sulfotransferase [Mycobacterium sp. Marseille-P9652]
MTVDDTESETAGRPIALFVLGMQRSGTSALTRVLSLCGGRLPPALLEANADNRPGYWEPRAALKIDEAILRRHGSGPYDPSLRLQDEGAFDAEEKAACIAEIGQFFDTLPVAELVIIKEPRITTLSGIWFEAARRAGYSVVAVIAVRHPQEVAASLAAINQTSPELASALWLKNNLLAEKETRSVPRVFVDYANLLDDWRRETKRISSALAIDLDIRDEDAIDEFLTKDSWHQRHDGPVIDLFGTEWITTVHATLWAAARDEPGDVSVLDCVFEAYRTSERVFRAAFKNFREDFRDNVRPPRGVLLHLFHRVAFRAEFRRRSRLVFRIEVRRLRRRA